MHSPVFLLKNTHRGGGNSINLLYISACLWESGYAPPGVTPKKQVAENSVRILKTALWKSITQSGSKRYLDSLQDIVTGLNDRPMPILGGKSPSQITPALQPEVFQLRYGKALEAAHQARPKIPIGTPVRLRLKHSNSVFGKGFIQQFSQEIYRVVKASLAPPRFLYSLADFYSGQKISGRYYREELSPIYIENQEKEEDAGGNSTD